MYRTLRLRFALAVIAIIQILLPTAADLANARTLAAETSSALVHIEAEGTRDCPTSHPDDCALCHFATHLTLNATRTASTSTTLKHELREAEPTGLTPVTRPGTLPPGRGPPTA